MYLVNNRSQLEKKRMKYHYKHTATKQTLLHTAHSVKKVQCGLLNIIHSNLKQTKKSLFFLEFACTLNFE